MYREWTYMAWIVVALLSGVVDAGAQTTRVVSASFFDPGNPRTGPLLSPSIAGVPPAQISVPTDVRVDNWNNLPTLYPIPSGLQKDLGDSRGTITSVDIEWIATDVSANSWAGGILNGDSTMMNGYLQSTTLGAMGLVTVQVSDLGGAFELASGYDVIVYADAESVGSVQSLFVDDGVHTAQAITMRDTVADAPPIRHFDASVDYDEGTTDGAGVWARFSGLTGGSFTVVATSVNVDEPAFINGLQIVGYAPISTSDADINLDGIVDGLDFLSWQRGISPRPYSAEQLRVWKKQWGAVPSPVHAIPEPSAWTLQLFFVVAALLQVRVRINNGAIQRPAQ